MDGGRFFPRRVFDESFSERLQIGILRCVLAGWYEGTRSVRLRFDYFSAHDLLGHERRAYIEQNLRAFAKRHKINCPKAKLNYARNSFHTELVSGRTVLTASALEWQDQMVREALFRNTMAREPQAHLFDEEIPPDSNDPLYGIICYGVGARRVDPIPGFVRVAFPNSTCSNYIDAVDLMGKYPTATNKLILRLRRGEGIA